MLMIFSFRIMFVVLLLAIVTCHVDMVHSSLVTTQEQCNDIIHVWRNDMCLSVCDDSSCGPQTSCDCFQHLKFDCDDYSRSGIANPVSGYWYDNNVSSYTLNCPGEYCDFILPWWRNDSWNMSSPDRNEQCRENWEGIACGECKENNSIIFDTFKCVSSSQCNKYGDLWHGWPWLLVFLSTILYWCIFIMLVVFVLNYASIGYAYGLLFYYSVLEIVVKEQVFDYFNDEHDYYTFKDDFRCYSSDRIFYIFEFESKILSSLASIGNLKPPHLQFMNLCINAQVIDHVFFVYAHPVIVISLLVIFAVVASRSVKLTQFIQRFSKTMINLILLLSYSSMSYTSVQLLKPLVIYNRFTGEGKWHMYRSPSVSFADGWRVLYVIVAVLCIVIFSIGLPLLLLFEKTVTSKLNLKVNLLLGQLQGCFKDNYRWFAAFYLICRLVIYITDLVSDFLMTSVAAYSNTPKHTMFLLICIIIMMIHVWFQPYKEKSLNIFDSAILMILLFSIFASHSFNFNLRITLWLLPLAIFLCYMTSSTKLKHIMIPFVCLGTLGSCVITLSPLFEVQIIVLIIAFVSFYYLVKCIRKTYKSCWQRKGGSNNADGDDDDGDYIRCVLLLYFCEESYRGHLPCWSDFNMTVLLE